MGFFLLECDKSYLLMIVFNISVIYIGIESSAMDTL